jgi:hypothetical protein
LSDVVDVAGGIARSTSIVSAGTDAGELAVLHYAPRGSALQQVPSSSATLDETLAEYALASGATDNFLSIVLGRVESRYALPGFAAGFQADFEAFLQSVDTDTATPGIQPFRDPSGNPILTLAAAQWFGPAQTWPRELENHPYIHFWHRLDAALAAAAIPGMGPELIGDAAWRTLFTSGPLTENPGIRITVNTLPRLQVQRSRVDQLGQPRPTATPADIGAIEAP